MKIKQKDLFATFLSDIRLWQIIFLQTASLPLPSTPHQPTFKTCKTRARKPIQNWKNYGQETNQPSRWDHLEGTLNSLESIPYFSPICLRQSEDYLYLFKSFKYQCLSILHFSFRPIWTDVPIHHAKKKILAIRTKRVVWLKNKMRISLNRYVTLRMDGCTRQPSLSINSPTFHVPCWRDTYCT